MIIIKAFDEQILDRSNWHQELLNIAIDKTPERPQVISIETYKLLKQLKNFGHFSTKAYKEKYEWGKMGDLEAVTEKTYNLLVKDLVGFSKYLKALMDSMG